MTTPPSSDGQRCGNSRTSATPDASVARYASVRLASCHAADGSTAQVIDKAVTPTSAAISASVKPPQKRRVCPPATIAAATRPPATISTSSSTFVSGPSCRPPPPCSARAVSTAPKASVASGSTATRGSVTRRANARGSAEATCEDTTPEPPAAGAECPGREQSDERHERRGDVVPRARQRAESQLAGFHELAADIDGLRGLAGLRDRLL